MRLCVRLKTIVFSVFYFLCSFEPDFNGIFWFEATSCVDMQHAGRVFFVFEEELVLFIINDLVLVRHSPSYCVPKVVLTISKVYHK